MSPSIITPSRSTSRTSTSTGNSVTSMPQKPWSVPASSTRASIKSWSLFGPRVLLTCRRPLYCLGLDNSLCLDGNFAKKQILPSNIKVHVFEMNEGTHRKELSSTVLWHILGQLLSRSLVQRNHPLRPRSACQMCESTDFGIGANWLLSLVLKSFLTRYRKLGFLEWHQEHFVGLHGVCFALLRPSSWLKHRVVESRDPVAWPSGNWY